MNAPLSSGNSPPRRRSLWIGVIIALLAVVITLALRMEEPTPESPAAKPLGTADTTPLTTPPEVPDRVLGLDAQVDVRGLARVEALRALGNDFTRDESTALLSALLTPRDPAAPEGPHSVWFHESALALQKQAAVREEFARTLATVARDGNRDFVIRDYALQHLCQLWHNSEGSLAATIQNTLSEITDESPSIAPSALLALHLLGSHSVPTRTAAAPRAVPDNQIIPRVRSMLAANTSATTAAQMTALRIVGERRLPGFHDDLGRIAADTSSGHTLVRMAAVAAIARFTDPGDLPLLRTLDRSDYRVASTIDHAIARIESIP